MSDCTFCKIVNGELPCHKIWEDKKHFAFLSIFPNTEGFSVVVTKKHHPSYAFDLTDSVLSELVCAAKKVGRLIDMAYEDVGRTGLMFEGFGVDHTHAKLFPMHGTEKNSWDRFQSRTKKYFEKYEGYISSNDAERADDAKLASVAEKIRSARK